MLIELVNESNFHNALGVYTASWQESHRKICSPEFLKKRDYAGYLRRKMGHLYLVSDDRTVGVFCLNGEEFSDLYIQPKDQGRGYGTACLRYAIGQSPRLQLTVLSSNTAAIALYEKMGFCFTGKDIPLRNGLFACEMIRYSEPK